MTNPQEWALFFAQDHNWHSIFSICRLMNESYHHAFPNCTFQQYQYSDYDTHFQVRKIALKLLKDKPQKLIFLDHSPPPFILLKLLSLLDKSYCPEIVLHLYGNFFHRFEYYFREQDYLKHYPCRLTAASSAQQELIRSSCLEGQDIFIFPFPSDINNWKFSQQERTEFRAKYKIASDENVIIFQGRKSMQKNILLLLDLFEEILKIKPQTRLLLLGDHDEAAPTYFTHYFCRQHGFFYQAYNERFNRFFQETKSRILDLSHLSASEVRAALCASDLFISPSLHHYEDFGLAPLEALSTGLPSLLSEWGGHLDFLKTFPQARGLSLNLDNQGMTLNREEAIAKILHILANKLPPEKRLELNQLSQDQYSPQALAKRLIKIHEKKCPEFRGFSSNFLDLKNKKINNTTNLLYREHIRHFMSHPSSHSASIS